MIDRTLVQQGMNDLSTPFILVFVADRADLSVSEAQAYTASKLSKEVLDQIEADVYWCFTRLLDNIQVTECTLVAVFLL